MYKTLTLFQKKILIAILASSMCFGTCPFNIFKVQIPINTKHMTIYKLEW